MSAPIDDHDVTAKKFVTDLVKTKVGTTYVNNELFRKPNNYTLSNYCSTNDLQTLASEFNAALHWHYMVKLTQRL